MTISEKQVFESVREFATKSKTTLSEYRGLDSKSQLTERNDKAVVAKEITNLLLEIVVKCSLLLTVSDKKQQAIKVEEAISLLSELIKFDVTKENKKENSDKS